MKFLLCSIICWLLAFSAAATPAEPLVLRDTAQLYPLRAYWEVLKDDRPWIDDEERLTFAQVQAPEFATRFEPRGTDPRTGKHDVWLRTQVRAESRAGTQWLLVAPTAASTWLDVYAVLPSGQVVRHELDPARPNRQTHAVSHRHYNVRIPLPPGQIVTLYLHSWASSINYSFQEQTHFLQRARQADVFAGLYFGILLALLAYNLLLYLSVRDKSYLLYVLYVASFTALQADMMGYLKLHLGDGLSLSALATVHSLLLSLTIFFGILTARAFLETRQLLPRFDGLLRWSLLLAWMPVLDRFIPLALPFLPDWPATAALWASVVLLLAGLLVLRTGYRPARYYMLGWGLLLAAVINFYLHGLGITPDGFWAEHGVHLASALETILLSLGLADRINLVKKQTQRAQTETLQALREKEAAQREVLSAMHDKQVAQEEALRIAREKDEVQQTANRTLAERANELQQAYQELQASIQTSDKLQELDELKTRFFTNISHELRTPLTLIISPLEQLLSEAGHEPGASARPEYSLMLRNARRLLQLINQLLDVARLESGQMRLAAAPADLTQQVRYSVAAFGSLAESRDVTLTVEVPPDPLEVYLDVDQFDKILYNLLGNALKFTPAGGKVQVSVAASGNAALVRVHDTGVGIPAEHLPLVFDRFHQVDSNLTRLHDGTGIGLALVKELVALHHGTVHVTSTVGEGTTFTVEIPLGCSHLPPEELATAPINSLAPSVPELREARQHIVNEAEADTIDASRPLVLVVEDNAEVRDYLRSCLAADFRVLTAADGEQGLQRITAAVPDLVVSDLMMPQLNGLDLCQRLRADERTSHIPVILLTARSEQETRLEGFEMGADEYLTKPFRPEELRARIHHLIRQRELLRQRFSRELKLELSEISVTSTDEAFLTRAIGVVEQHLGNSDFSVEAFAEHMAMSRVQLHRKLKALTDQSTSEFVRTLRLRRAAVLLQGQAGHIAEVAESVGFANISYFTKCFRELYHQTPSEYAANHPVADAVSVE
ncbi:7TM diverse intracellular signaling domain-containing protein [Hymenobacter koreensis]|uniref:histidine kinase n=1 Tax=Hymenobacter koreensis TaxID=1084523 RepID=A0ABP8J047_9BACT